ncbi:MAG: acyl-CoA dehydrogenase family protein [Acidimicrobiia bacterium]
MQLELTDEQVALRDTVRRFIESEVPLTTVRELYDDPNGFNRDWWREAASLGWTSPFIPEAQGGGTLSGRPCSDAVIIAEEIGRLVAPGPFLPTNVVAAAVARSGNESLIEDVLPGLAEGGTFAAWAFAEPGDCWEPECFKTTITVAGDTVTVSGEKAYVEAANVADHFLVTGRGEGGLTQVLVPADASGVQVIPGRSIDMTRRYGRVRFAATEVHTDSVLGPHDSAEPAVAAQLQLALTLQCAEMVGVAEQTLDTTIAYGRERFAFGRPIVSFQALKHRIADMALWIEGSKAVGEELVHAVGDARSDAGILASVAKVHIGRRCLDIVDDCVQITGGMGVTWEHDIHMYSRRAAVDRAMFGSPELHRHRLLAFVELDNDGSHPQEGDTP